MKHGYSIPMVLILISFMFIFALFIHKILFSSLKITKMEFVNQKVFAMLESGEMYVIYHWADEPPSNVFLKLNGMNLRMQRLSFSSELNEALYRYTVENGVSTLKGTLKVKKDDIRRFSQ